MVDKQKVLNMIDEEIKVAVGYEEQALLPSIRGAEMYMNAALHAHKANVMRYFRDKVQALEDF